jgi:hypothetical protein
VYYSHSASSSISFTTIYEIELIYYVFVSLCLSVVFAKAGQSWWKAFIPIYNEVVLFQIIGLSPWLILLFFVPFVNLILFFYSQYKLSVAFGKGIGMTLFLFFLNPIALLVLGLGSAQYRGPLGRVSRIEQYPYQYGPPQPTGYQPTGYQPTGYQATGYQAPYQQPGPQGAGYPQPTYGQGPYQTPTPSPSPGNVTPPSEFPAFVNPAASPQAPNPAAGSPIMPPPAGIPASWLVDPTGRHQYRYFDGSKWTEHVSDNGQASVDPV